MTDEDFDKIVYEFFANYTDPGMKKWGGFRLSEHIEKIEGDKNN